MLEGLPDACFFQGSGGEWCDRELHPGQQAKRGASRKAFAAMVRVMGLTMRARKLRLLKNVSSIAIGLDDMGTL